MIGGGILPKSDAQKRAQKKWESNNYEAIGIRVKKGNRERVKAYAEKKGESINSFVKRLISDEMKEKIE